MAINKENQKVANEINEDEFLEAQLPPLTNLETSFKNSNTLHRKKSNNNRHVVPFGILVIFCTLYITASAFQRTNDTKSTILEDETGGITTISELRQNENQQQTTYLDKLLDQNDICNELEIFVNKFQWTKKYDEQNNACGKDESKEAETETDPNNRYMAQQKRKQPTTATHKRKYNNGKHLKNGQNGKRYNRSTIKTRKNTNKHSIANKKEQNTKKKSSSTAEPIIYLFALVLIYLLFKAATDINQHYKSQAKGDKRLRRCSLQSYAQAHKQDRRASKDQPLKIIKHTHHLLEHRSQSLDRCMNSYPNKESIEKLDFLNNLRKHISFDEPVQNSIQRQKCFTTSNESTKQTQSIGNISLLSSSELSKSRRYSVPALSAPLKPKAVVTLPSRRTSVVHGTNAGQLGQLGSSTDATDPFQFSESKRRVRMINRH